MAGRTILIGDIHGCWEELQDLLSAVGLTAEDTLISVGDVVDRGPDPGAVVRFFQARPKSVVLCGNHERKHVRGVLSYAQQIARLQMGEGYAAAVAWMGGLPYFYETPEIRAVHWGMFPGVPLAETPVEVLAGTTSGDALLRERLGEGPWYSRYTDDTPIAFGHSVVGREPMCLGVGRGRVFGLDTGACHGWSLSALILPERRVVSVPARADHWAAVRAAWQEPVLRTLDWAEMTFAQIEKKAASLRDPELPDGVIDRVLAWSAALQAARPLLWVALERVSAGVAEEAERVGEPFGQRAALHPAGSYLLRQHRGRLSREQVGCDRPQHVVMLAGLLGVEVPASW